MAKKKKETGPGPVMIIILVFFILATAMLGVTTYLGFEGEAEYKAAAEKAAKDKSNAESALAKETARRNVLRVALGVEDPQDREDLAGAAKSYKGDILEEHKRINDRMAGALPTNSFRWPLIDDLAAGGDGEKKPSPAPNKTIPSIAKEWAKMFQDADKRAKDTKLALDAADAQKKAAEDQKAEAKTTFDQKLAELDNSYKAAIAKLTTDFNNLKVEADKAGKTFEARAAEFAKEKDSISESLQSKNKDAQDLKEKLTRALNPSQSDLEQRFKNLDLTKLEESKGEIATKIDNKTVTLQFKGRNNLVVGQTFMVLAPNKSLVTVIERERVLDRDYRDRRGLFDREPFSGNEMIKGLVEITEVTSAYTARARVVAQSQEIQDPISKKDAIYNITLAGNIQEHVAFCGIIDLDGDGLPNNEEFIRILEKNGVIVDAYLDLTNGEIKGRGIQPSTKFLILGPEASQTGKIKEMMDQAKEKGVQIIDARKFLKLIGVSIPSNPIPPRYSTTNITGAGPAKKEDGAAEPKKDEPKKDEAAPDKKNQ